MIKKKKLELFGWGLMIFGFIIIFFNAIIYIFNILFSLAWLSLIGLAFVICGLKILRILREKK